MTPEDKKLARAVLVSKDIARELRQNNLIKQLRKELKHANEVVMQNNVKWERLQEFVNAEYKKAMDHTQYTAGAAIEKIKTFIKET